MSVGSRNGQVYFLTDYTLETDVTVTFAGMYGLALEVKAGTWFCNAMAAWIYLGAQISAVTGEAFTILFRDRYDDADVGKITIENYGLWDTMTFTNDTAPEPFWRWLGGSSSVITFTAGEFTTGVLPGFYYPYWPLRSYEKGVQHASAFGGVQRAFAGNAGSWGTAPRETVTLSVNIDRQSGSTELEDWYTLWRTRWRQGKTVSMYFFDERTVGMDLRTNRLYAELYSFPSFDIEDDQFMSGYSWHQAVLQCDQLQYADETPTLKPARLIDHKSIVSFDGPHKFQRASIGGQVLRGYSRPWMLL